MDAAARALRLAWWSLVLFPVAFVVAMVVGEGIPALLGYSEPSLDNTPWWVISLVAVAAVAVFAVPVLITARLGRRAVNLGEREGRIPLIVAVAVVGVFVLLNLVGLVAQFLD